MLARAGRKDVEVFSAGVTALPGAKTSEEAVEAMAKESIGVSDHSAVTLREERIEEADLVLTMDSLQKEKVLEMVPQAKGKVFLLKEFAGDGEIENSPTIPDPIGKSLEDYEACARQIKEAVKKVVGKI